MKEKLFGVGFDSKNLQSGFEMKMVKQFPGLIIGGQVALPLDVIDTAKDEVIVMLAGGEPDVFETTDHYTLVLKKRDLVKIEVWLEITRTPI